MSSERFVPLTNRKDQFTSISDKQPP